MSRNKENADSKFWKNITYLRKKLGLSQESMAYDLNITRSRLSSWEENRAKPWLMTLVRVSLYFGIGMHELIMNDLEKEGIVPNCLPELVEGQ